MAVFNLYSKRQKALRGEVPEIFIYDDLSINLRRQIVFIVRDAFGVDKIDGHGKVMSLYKFIADTLCREYGLFDLIHGQTYIDKVQNYLLYTKDIELTIDAIELCFRCVDRAIDSDYLNYVNVKVNSEKAIEELNDRFRENGVGYCYAAGEIIRIDSTVLHNEITKPAINLLWNDKFENANEEYLKAQEHYRHGRNEECLNDCLKALESVMKIICAEKGWGYGDKDGASKLIQLCLNNNLIPAYLQTQFTSLKVLMESGIPAIRNNISAHGKGEKVITADDQLTRYALNLAGANIIFLVEQSMCV